MPVQQRLPIIDGDDGVWGEILNQFITKEHYNTGVDNAANGGHQTITVRAGTTAAGTAPLKFTSGSLMTTAEVGAIEFLSDSLYFTVTTSAVRRTIAAYNDASGATGDIYYRDSAGSFTRLAIGSTNDILKVTAGLPSWGPATGGRITWTTVTGTSQTAAVNSGFITNNASLVTVTIPTTAAVGDVIVITGQGAGGWRLSQNASQTIYFGNATTTTGTGGNLASTHRRDSITLVCVTVNSEWEVYSSIGSITYV